MLFSPKSKIKILFKIFLHLTFGPFMIIFESFFSFYEFLVSIFKTNLTKTKQKMDESNLMTENGIKILIACLREFKASNQKLNQIPVKLVILKL